MSVPLREMLLLLPVALAAGLCAPAHAQRQPPPERSERVADARAAQPTVDRRMAGRQERRQDSMADSIRYLRRSNRGQVLSAERMHSDGREINRIKMVDDRGRVRVFEDDPQRRRSQRQRSRVDND